MSNSLVQTYDGVGAVVRGNLILILYAADARLARTQWLFDRVDALANRSKDPILVLMVITESAGPPDAATRAENTRRFKQVGKSIRSMATVALGDAFKTNIVRSIMRAMLLLQGQAAWHFVATTVDEGFARLYKEAGAGTPPLATARDDLGALAAALGVRLDGKPMAATV